VIVVAIVVGDVVSPLASSQISNSTTSRKRLFSDVQNYFTVNNNKATGS
jgi:hypothetical protein